MATLLPNGKQTFVDANGNPLASGLVYFYVPGTTTLKNTWQDAGQTILNTNPVQLDSAGRAIIYGSGAYRQLVKDSLGNTIWDQITSDTSSGSNSWAGTSAGTANAQTVSATNFTSQDGQSIDFIAGFTNNGALTLNPNGTGPINVLKDLVTGPVSCSGGEVVAGNLVRAVYSSATGSFHLTAFPIDTRQTLTDLASATTTNLGSIASRSVRITGTTTITSFGSSADTTNPWYYLKFAGALTLTYNATSLLLPGAANITTAANDTAIALYMGTGNWQIVQYTRVAATTPPTNVSRRQTVVSGPTDSSGYANFLPASGSGLTITSQNISSTAPLVVSAGAGAAQYVPASPSSPAFYSSADRVGYATANLTWGSLTNTTTNYLFVSVAIDGTLTAGSTTTIPIYQFGGTVSVTNGQYTYVISEGKMYLGNGTTAAQVFVVFVGEAITSGGNVTSTVAYAYNGIYEFTDTSSLPSSGTQTTKNHNIGIADANGRCGPGVQSSIELICVSAEGNYVSGDIENAVGSSNGTSIPPLATKMTRNTISFTAGAAASPYIVNNATTGGQVLLTLANWRYRLKAWRIW